MIRLPQTEPPVVMGVLNVTPDSFSDGGEYLDLDRAVNHGLGMAAEGADIIDVGGESTRPGAMRVDAGTEIARVIPVVRALAGAGVRVSIDTMRAEVAQSAVEAGAMIVNDVSAGLADPEMLGTVADLEVDYVMMHWRGHSAQMDQLATYQDVVTEVISELGSRMAAAVDAGISPDRIILDPGLGFAKTAEHNWLLLARVGEFSVLGRPILIGASRKRFLGELLADEDGPRPASQRDDATLALTALLATSGIWGVRTHQVRAHLDAIAVARRLQAAVRGDRVGHA